MKTAILLLAFAGVALCESQVPTFVWLPESHSPSGVPHLLIHFNDGKPDDIAVLRRFNPVPRLADEKEESIDKCIFDGHLMLESDVYVTLTGGCPFQDTFDIQFRSERLVDHMFQSRDGVVSVVPSVYKTRGLVRDVALHPPAHVTRKEKTNEPLPKARTMTVSMNIDQTFKGFAGGDEVNILRRVAAQAANMYQWSSLDVKLNWNTLIEYEIPDSIEADESSLSFVGQYNSGNANSHVYMCYQNGASGVVGIAWVGTICSSMSYRTAVVEYFNNDMNTAEILAHEVGHNTGMSHDFTGSPGNPRYDSQGNTCTNIGGVMDYYQTVTRWSTCSNEDFASTSTGCLGK